MVNISGHLCPIIKNSYLNIYIKNSFRLINVSTFKERGTNVFKTINCGDVKIFIKKCDFRAILKRQKKHENNILEGYNGETVTNSNGVSQQADSVSYADKERS